MKYKIIVDKQPRTNPSSEKKTYEIDIEELRYKGNIHDSLIITKEEDYVIRRLSLSKYQVLSVLDTPKKEPLEDINIELFEGDNYIYLADMTGNYFYAEYLIKNQFNDLYVIHSEMESAINQTASQIDLSVNQKLEGYSTKTETETSLKVVSEAIKLEVKEVKENAIANVDVQYALSTSETTAPETGWSTTAPAWQNGKYMWQKTVTTLADGTVNESTATCISGAKGASGKDGAKGIGIKKVVEQYYLSTSNTTQTGGSWKTSQDKWTTGHYIWTRSQITWDDNTTSNTDPVLSTNLDEAFSQISQTKEAITQKVGKGELGTLIEQNADHVKVAFNKISEFIQLGVLNDIASFLIKQDSNTILMALDKLGQHFYGNDKKVFGEMGVFTEKKQTGANTYETNDYIAFSVTGDYNKTINNGMAWGIKTSSDNKFHPIFYVKNFEMGAKNSDACFGQLVLTGCDLLLEGLETGIISGNVKIYGDPLGGLIFSDVNSGNVLFSVIPPNSALDEYGTITILDKISFYRNWAGSNSLKIGNTDNSCLFTDEGSMSGKTAYLTEKVSTNTIECFQHIYCNNGVESFSTIKKKKKVKKYNKSGLEEVLKTDIFYFNYKEDDKNAKRRIGTVIGNGYNCSEDILSQTGESISDYSMISVAYKAIQEQQVIIEEQQKQIKENNKLIKDLLTRVEALEKGRNNG